MKMRKLQLLSIILMTMIMNSCNGQAHQPTVRPATQAGRFYEADPHVLSHGVDSFLALHANDSVKERPVAIIVPHAGYYYSGNVAADGLFVFHLLHGLLGFYGSYGKLWELMGIMGLDAILSPLS